MTIQVHVENIFPTPIYSTIINLNFDEFDINSYNMNYSHGSEQYVSISDDENVLNRSEFLSLKKTIDAHMNNFYHNILQYEENTYPWMSSSWIVKSLPNQRSVSHIHSNSIFSGVFYLNAPENCGDIIFTLHPLDDRNLTRIFDPQRKSENQYNQRTYHLRPRNNMLIIFPSNLTHEVGFNTGREDRVSIAFNYFLKGEFQSRGGKLSLS